MATSTPASAQWYRWADERGPEAVCITVTRGLDLHEALSILGADIGSEHRTDFDSAESEWDIDAMPLQVGRVNGALVFVEPNGWAGVQPERLATLSRPARAVSVYWNVNALMTVLVAEDGQIVRSMDPVLYEADGALEEEADLPFGEPGMERAAALALLYRLAHFEVTADWLTNEVRPTYTVRSPRSS